jgi:hypothetical protein
MVHVSFAYSHAEDWLLSLTQYKSTPNEFNKTQKPEFNTSNYWKNT